MTKRSRAEGGNPGFPEGDADMQLRTSAAWWATRLNYVVAKYDGTDKPRHRERSATLRTPTGELTTFCIGRFLNQVAEICLEGNAHTLGTACMQLSALPWFDPWLAQLRAARSKREPKWSPSIDEAVLVVIEAFPVDTTDPAPDRQATFAVSVAPECGTTQPLAKWMPRFAEARRSGGMHAKLLARLEALPWAIEWIADLDGSHASAARRRVLTKMARIELLLLNCRREMPTAATIVPVSCPLIDEGVWFWRPRGWLDDVVENWIRPESANTRLDASEMEVMETALPWVREWIDTKRAARERRVAQRR